MRHCIKWNTYGCMCIPLSFHCWKILWVQPEECQTKTNLRRGWVVTTLMQTEFSVSCRTGVCSLSSYVIISGWENWGHREHRDFVHGPTDDNLMNLFFIIVVQVGGPKTMMYHCQFAWNSMQPSWRKKCLTLRTQSSLSSPHPWCTQGQQR